jgi:hypothetical protein
MWPVPVEYAVLGQIPLFLMLLKLFPLGALVAVLSSAEAEKVAPEIRLVLLERPDLVAEVEQIQMIKVVMLVELGVAAL